VNTPPRRPCLTTCRTLTTRLKSEPPVVGRSYKHSDAPANGLHTDRIPTKSATGDGENIILPLFGKRSDVSRSKYQYYTMSNTGVVNTKPRSTRTGSVPATGATRYTRAIGVRGRTARSMRRFTRRICCGTFRECELSNMAV
jgi:hypothetical protein